MDLNNYLAVTVALTEQHRPDIEISETTNGFQAEFTFFSHELYIKVTITDGLTTIMVIDDDYCDVHDSSTQNGNLAWIENEIRTARRTQAIVAAATA